MQQVFLQYPDERNTAHSAIYQTAQGMYYEVIAEGADVRVYRATYLRVSPSDRHTCQHGACVATHRFPTQEAALHDFWDIVQHPEARYIGFLL